MSATASSAAPERDLAQPLFRRARPRGRRRGRRRPAHRQLRRHGRGRRRTARRRSRSPWARRPTCPPPSGWPSATRRLAVAQHALAETRRFWAGTLGDLRVETNQPAFDRLVNDWLPYQLLTARLWGRCGPSQRGGAFGFRDQLQDVLPLFATRPDLARRQILLHARQQFLEGDVLQWWHPARDRRHRPGRPQPRLRPASVAALPDRALRRADRRPGHPRRAGAVPRGSADPARVPRASTSCRARRARRRPLYDHCCRAIDFTLGRIGPHGLPLIGSGDWNDGLSRFGEGGSGESVWLGFFLYDMLVHFADLAQERDGRRQGRRLPRARRADPAARSTACGTRTATRA